MNMWTVIVCTHLCFILFIRGSMMCFTNLIHVDTDLGHHDNSLSATQSLKDKPNKGLAYDPTVLKTICNNVKHDQ